MTNNNLQGIKEEIINLRKRGITQECETLEVDILKVLDNLMNASLVDEVEYLILDEEGYGIECTMEEWREIQEDIYDLEYVSGDNTYNYLGNVSNHINWEVYKSEDGYTYINFKVQEGYGDVRAHYTQEAWLKVDSYNDFLEVIYDSSEHIDFYMDGVEETLVARINPLSELIEVFYEYGEDVGSYVAYDLEELQELVKEEIGGNK